ncbi:DUF6943 family protein [Mongoliibacter ruber]|uniref:Uncharacterized protein n=1 Tax=Mongoliibacter ruber TaxID=1750599 RepID=A0A2T0WV62_9BACT|nr:hypothetical protein [Mongoliibacter ruber]PRY90582.1 hypothetical protein CLW00_101245 [Mongoliibacter ruber]
MINYVIKTHTPGFQPSKPHLFALSKGYNAGRPMKTECPNCFLITCHTQDEADKMFFLLDGLWRSQIFRMQLVGSVIPFLHVHEFSKTINRYWKHIHESENRVERLVTAFAAIEKLQNEINGLNKLLDQYKAIAYIDVLKTQKVEF